MRATPTLGFQWLRTGREAFAAMFAAIDQAQGCVRLETYIYADSHLGRLFRDRLLAARQRGVRVKVLVDAFGSVELQDGFWQELRSAGAECRWFNPLSLRGFGFRDHRKLLVCDEVIAFVGGFNVADEYHGDGVEAGWCDHGMAITNELVTGFVQAFENMFDMADMQYRPFTRLRKSVARQKLRESVGEMLLTGPGRGFNPYKRALHLDLKQARRVHIVCAYFLPTWNIRRMLGRVARRGGVVQLILPGKSDVALAQKAAHGLYQGLMRNGVEIYEYQPQVLHAKLIIADHAVYVGSANLDARSLNINYEIMVRMHTPALAAEAREVFAEDLRHSRRLDPEVWRKSRSLWTKFKERCAYWMLARLDPYLARAALRRLGGRLTTPRHRSDSQT
jgi:cardiolipin synthase